MPNESYKRWHKPNANARTEQGYYKITKPEKYIGDPNLVIYRSGWERKFCVWCENNENVIKWGSEPIKIPYYNRIANLDECKKYKLDPNNPRNWKVSNYNIDFWIEIKKNNNEIEKWLIEIKPKKDCSKPDIISNNAPLKEQKRYNLAAKTWLINEAKWAAAEAFCNKQGWKFYVFHEDILEKLGVLKIY